MGPTRLPIEPTDCKINFCHNDRRTPSNSTLTHSPWFAVSHFHLFHTVVTTGVHSGVQPTIQLKSIVRGRQFPLSHRQLQYIRKVKIEPSVNVFNYD